LAGLVDTVDDPAYATAVGLMLLDILMPSQGGGNPKEHQSVVGDLNGLFDRLNKITGFFKK
jgi:hypothetical protein